MSTPDVIHSEVATPLGELVVGADGDSVTSVRFAQHARLAPLTRASRRDDGAAVLREAARQLAAYFAGELRSFALPLAPPGSAFQRRAWEALAEIPYGETATYGALARRLGAPGHARAVGHANARNPLSIFVPCHRVVGARGALTGYAGGLARKRWLLDHERALAQGASR